MREDIYGSLKNALERGATMEEAIRSLINSGYSEADVRETADQITPGAISTITPITTQQFSPHKLPRESFRPPSLQKVSTTKFVRKRTGKIIFLVILLLVLVGLLLLTILFRERVVNFLMSLF